MISNINASNPTLKATLLIKTPTSNGILGVGSLARGGATVASSKALIDADLATMIPDTGLWLRYILINLGANDVANMPSQAQFESDLGYYMDAYHTKYPNAKVYVMRPWRRNFNTNCNTLAGFIANVVAARSAWAFLGPDERVFLENGDDGVTYTVEGIHPNTAGYALTATQWQTALGL